MKLYKNILTKKERLSLLKFAKTKVIDLGPNFPGLQSKPDFHTYKEMNILLDKIKKHYTEYKINKCWANFSSGDYISWHSHPSNVPMSMIYFIKNPYNLGPFFKRDQFEVFVSKCPENSLILFDSSLIHSVPCHLKADRYSIAFDLARK